MRNSRPVRTFRWMILVPVDGSSDALHALGYACDFAKLLGTELHVCHAASDAPTKWMRDEGEAILANARAIARRHDVTAHSHLLCGDPAKAILRLARDARADLLIMGTHGVTGLRATMLGSVAEAITRSSVLPVLLLRDPTYELNGGDE